MELRSEDTHGARRKSSGLQKRRDAGGENMVRGFLEKRKWIVERGKEEIICSRGDLCGKGGNTIYLGSSTAESGNCVDMKPRKLCKVVFASRIRHFVEVGSLGNQTKAEIDFLLELVLNSDR